MIGKTFSHYQIEGNLARAGWELSSFLYIPTKDLIRESLDWLDRYLGPVQ